MEVLVFGLALIGGALVLARRLGFALEWGVNYRCDDCGATGPLGQGLTPARARSSAWRKARFMGFVYRDGRCLCSGCEVRT